MYHTLYLRLQFAVYIVVQNDIKALSTLSFFKTE